MSLPGSASRRSVLWVAGVPCHTRWRRPRRMSGPRSGKGCWFGRACSIGVDLIFIDSYLGPATIGHVAMVWDLTARQTIEAANPAKARSSATTHAWHLPDLASATSSMGQAPVELLRGQPRMGATIPTT